MKPTVILTERDLDEAVSAFEKQPAFAWDIETTGPRRGHPVYNELAWLSMATKGRTVAIPMGHPNGDVLTAPAVRRKDKATGKMIQIPARYSPPPPQVTREQVIERIAPLMASDRLKIGHGQVFDAASVTKYLAAPPAPPFADTLVGAWMLNENFKRFGLKEIVGRRYKTAYDPDHTGRCVEAHPLGKVARYALLDAKFPWLMWPSQKAALHAQNLDKIFGLEMDLLPVLVSMRLAGVAVDEQTLRTLEAELAEQLDHATERTYKAAGKSFNLGSVPQKQAILYGPKDEGGQGLKAAGRTKTGAPSTDADALKAHPNNPVTKALLAYQELHTLQSTYVHGYLGTEDEPGALVGGRIHCDFVQYGTRTGRFSSRNPNLQNVPRPGKPLSTRIRGLFVAPPGMKLIVADYGQIELRVLAHFLGRGALYEGFHQGIDAHTATATSIFHISPDQVTKDWRQVAKAVNFAIVFLAGAETVAGMAGISVREARRILTEHELRNPEIYQYRKAVIEGCRRQPEPHITTLLGRVRRLPEIRYRNGDIRALAERQAVNSKIQGSAGDLIKLAMVRTHAALPEGARLVLTVHDELVVEAANEVVAEAEAILREAMLGQGIADLLTVPLTSDIVVCNSWAEAK